MGADRPAARTVNFKLTHYQLAGRVLHWPSMRILAVIIVAIFSFLSVGCTEDGVMLQPPVQGEWADFHNDQKKISVDAREEAAKPPAEK
jgi:hypothetical protein